MDQWVIVTGSLRGLVLVGPFATYDEAFRYAEANENDDLWKVWDILPVSAPTPYQPNARE